MSLSGTFGLAQSALASNAAQSALISRNIANVNNPDYARRSAGVVRQIYGTVEQGPTQRATDAALLANLLKAQAASTSSQALADGLTQIASMLGLDGSTSTSDTVAADRSPSTLIGALSNALQQYAAQPDNASAAAAAIDAAKSLASGLRDASASVQSVRKQADSDISSSVSTINSLLKDFKVANDKVVSGTRAGLDVSDAMDARDGILKQLSNEIGITTVAGDGNSLSIYTDSGVTLFETSPRTVSFAPTSGYSASTIGQAITVDGVAITGSAAVMPIKSGRIAGLTELRDTTAVAYQNQLDQIAGGLVAAFAESDQSGTGKPTLPGLFTAAGLSGVPTGTIAGLASSITINDRVDPSAGGLATRLRDGNIATDDSAYTYNSSNASAYSDRLRALTNSLSQARAFDTSSGGAGNASLAVYAQSSASWLEAARQSASNDASYKSTLAASTTTALSNATGVSLDDEMAKMLEVEHAYQASAQLLNTVNSMYATLLQAFN